MDRHKSTLHPTRPSPQQPHSVRAPALASGVSVKGLSRNGTGGSTWGLVGTPDGLDYQNGGGFLIFYVRRTPFLPGGEPYDPLATAVPKATRQRQRDERKTGTEEAGKPVPNHSLHPRSCMKLRHHGEGGAPSSFTNDNVLSIINCPALSSEPVTLGRPVEKFLVVVDS
ncbi:hypothetical protein BDP55DRAFT_630466 [Colletotrichum godetiae]|uniref:Uncharacterized protein n=1 Tax=Colletotrichum godetiae TaxID=1209918 RepID=A0AAJ0EUN5_9PEZI|nr:uncharacterized protein BDP55DRAFT_630466 [Colletotrichum godetiae]KAK1687834.1 hypothetical protein BDP55DRAFT_630466 [Colletotrichum godetiae]